MRVLLTHPFFWPHVRRGGEREVHDVAVGLRARGHDASVLTGAPSGLTLRGEVDGVPVRYVHVPSRLGPRRVATETTWSAVTAVAGAASRADVVASFHFQDAYGLVQGRRLRRRLPVVFKITGFLSPAGLRASPLHDRMARSVLECADDVWCNARWVADGMAELGRPIRVVPAGVDGNAFRPNGTRASVPTVLVASSADDARKRLVDLFAAWPAVVDAVPAARLRVAGGTDDDRWAAMTAQLSPAVLASIDRCGERGTAQLAVDYGEAWVTVAPAVDEALGLCVLESLTTGTPVVAARSGAHPELLSAAGVGALVEPASPDDLAAALATALADPPTPEVVAACTAQAAPYSWSQILPVVERHLLAAAG